MRYKTILAAKIEEEKKEELQQKKLKEKNGIDENDVIVKKRTKKQFGHAIFAGLLNIIRFIFAAIGILVMIDPALRETFIQEVLGLIAH